MVTINNYTYYLILVISLPAGVHLFRLDSYDNVTRSMNTSDGYEFNPTFIVGLLLMTLSKVENYIGSNIVDLLKRQS